MSKPEISNRLSGRKQNRHFYFLTFLGVLSRLSSETGLLHGAEADTGICKINTLALI
jgi:hypothetical protein